MTVEKVVFPSQILGRDFEYRILLPEGGIRPLPTLYLLHGYGGSSAQWLEKSDAKRWAEAFGLAIVLPSAGSGYYQDNPRTGERMKTFIGEELVAHTRARFPLSPRREDTFIAGVSMGGFGGRQELGREADLSPAGSILLGLRDGTARILPAFFILLFPGEQLLDHAEEGLDQELSRFNEMQEHIGQVAIQNVDKNQNC